jgi:hypothetical protein
MSNVNRVSKTEKNQTIAPDLATARAIVAYEDQRIADAVGAQINELLIANNCTLKVIIVPLVTPTNPN